MASIEVTSPGPVPVRTARSGAAVLGETMARPYDQSRATVGPLETRSFVARGFGQPLLVGNGIVQGASWQQLVLLQRQLAEIDGSILGVHPVIHVVRSSNLAR